MSVANPRRSSPLARLRELLFANIFARTDVALYIVALVAALFGAIAQPLWAMTDESAHYDVMAQYAHGVFPRVGTTPAIRSETLSLDVALDDYGYDIVRPRPVLSDLPLAVAPTSIPKDAVGAYNQRHYWESSYELSQPPLYYATMTPVWALGDAIAGPLGAAYAVRIMNALLVAGVTPLVFLLVREVWPRRRCAAVFAALLVAVLPGFVINTTSINNDTPMAVVGTVALLIAVRAVRRGWSIRSGLGVGAALGAGFLTKATIVGLVPALGVALLLPLPTDRRAWFDRLRIGACLVGVTSVGILPWRAITLARYPTTSPAGGAPASVLSGLHGSLVNWALTMVLGEPTAFTLSRGYALLTVASGVCLVGSIGLIVAIARRRGESRTPQLLWILLVAGGGQLAVAVLRPALTHQDFFTVARYTYPAIAAYVALVGIGLSEALITHRLRLAVGGVLTAYLVATLWVYPVRMQPPRAHGSGHPAQTATVHPVSAAADFYSARLEVDSWARDAEGLWIHVTASNHGTTMMEWSPIVLIGVNCVGVRLSDYLGSTPFTASIRPGTVQAGWMGMGPDSPSFHDRPIDLVFPDVTPDLYRELGNVDLLVRLN